MYIIVALLFIIGISLFIGRIAYKKSSSHQRIENTVMSVFATSFIAFLLSSSLSPGFIGGWEEHDGEAIGRVVDVRYGGSIFNTTEVTIMYGDESTKTSAITSQYSSPDKAMYHKYNALMGKTVKIKYKRWHSAPWRMGDTNDIIVE